MFGIHNRKYILYILLTAFALLTGCSDDAEPAFMDEDVQTTPATVYINLRLAKSADGFSRAGDNPTDLLPETPGTSREDAIKTIDLLVFTIDGSGTARLSRIYNLAELAISKIFDNGYTFPLEVNNAVKLRIYAAANLTDAMRHVLLGDKGLSTAIGYPYNTYCDLMNCIVPGSSGFQSLYENSESGIPMTGQFTTADGATDIVIDMEGNSESTPLTINATLKRIVAKMHTLVTPAPDGSKSPDGHPYIKSVDDEGNQVGWIRLGDVRYTPNGVSKSTLLFEQLSANGTGVDPTMDLDIYREGEALNEQMWRDGFVCHTGYALHDDNLNSAMAVADLLDLNRLNATLGTEGYNTADRYTAGMYCTENYFNLPAANTFFANYDEPLPMVTHLAIAARFTPRIILIEPDFKTLTEKFVTLYKNNKNEFWKTYGDGEPYSDAAVAALFSEDDANYWETIKGRFDSLPTAYGYEQFTATDEKAAQFVINVSLKENKVWSAAKFQYRNGLYSNGTFFVYDRELDGPIGDAEVRYLYLTAGAVAAASGDNHNIKSLAEAHPGGWGYYYTYLTNNRNNTATPVPYTESQIYRNTYYLVTIANFGSPGGRYTSPQLIKVNTDRISWSYAGRGDIYLK